MSWIKIHEEAQPDILDILYHRPVIQKVNFTLKDLKKSYGDLSNNLF